jgi:hypothetical protein
MASERMGSTGASVRSLTSDVADHVFAYGFRPTKRHSDILGALSSGSLSGVHPVRRQGAFHVADGHRRWCGQFSGLSFGATSSSFDHSFVSGNGTADSEPLVRVDEGPFVVAMRLDRSAVFLSACAELVDLDEGVARGATPLPWFSRLVPLMMFLRASLGNRVWHSDAPKACFIIDDPSLRNGRYGFLEYGRLVDSLQRLNFSTSIAFIPWNYRRSSAPVTTLFAGPSGPSLCVHGLDHTRGEFAATDARALGAKARLALERMQIHRERSGIPFDDVMVFPQGLFSPEALVALDAAGYLAAVNTDVFPATSQERLHLRDLLDVAISRPGACPLFSRRYPRDIAEFAFDLFMGKPALAVAHHGYFRHGYSALESFVQALNRLDERLEWSGLGAICSSASLKKAGEDGTTDVRFFTSRYRLTNRDDRPRPYVLRRLAQAGLGVPTVTVDGRPHAAEQHGGELSVHVALDPGRTVDIAVQAPVERGDATPLRETLRHQATTACRRVLSEFRDNYVQTSPLLSALAGAWTARRGFGVQGRASSPSTPYARSSL